MTGLRFDLISYDLFNLNLTFTTIKLPYSMSCVLVTLSFNAKMVLADFECNIKDSQKWPREGDLFFVGT